MSSKSFALAKLLVQWFLASSAEIAAHLQGTYPNVLAASAAVVEADHRPFGRTWALFVCFVLPSQTVVTSERYRET